LTTPVGQLAGHWVELVYDLGLSDRITRPLLRFEGTEAPDTFLPPASLGRGIWRGRIPAGCERLLFSPVDAVGYFSFRIVSLKKLKVLDRVKLATRKPKWIALALFKSLLADVQMADRFWNRALSTPLTDYSTWSLLRYRTAEEFDCHSGIPLHLYAINIDGRANQTLDETESLDVQHKEKIGELFALLDEDAWFILTGAELTWHPNAVAAIGGEISREDCDVIYGDEIVDGDLQLKPDWSPILARQSPFMGQAWAMRIGWARKAIADLCIGDLLGSSLVPNQATRVSHIRRPLVSRTFSGYDGHVHAQGTQIPIRNSSCSVIIPTRDRVDLLQQCLTSLNAVEAGCKYEVIVVNNDSKEQRTLDFFDELRALPSTRVLDVAGDFNFSLLCNTGAAVSEFDTLVFLNNDTEAKTPGWLATLVSLAYEAQAGAVGAKLFYPDGRIQHQGVVIGIDGQANHFERFMAAGKTSYFHFGGNPREVAAVTGACLAVARDKFNSVGGFDQIKFPIEFSDIDLCLRLYAKGWTSIMVPAVELVHYEAASRKIRQSHEKRYALQVEAFKTRWKSVLRDDPYFHPMLSLYWHGPALG
jgi:O-antigen biosynthesis protein